MVEADEYAGNFDAYRPDIAVLTGAEWDHPDVFADRRRGHRRVRGLAAAGCADGGDARRQRRRSRRRARGRSPARAAVCTSSRMRWSTRRPVAAATCAASASGSRRPPARRRRCSAGSSRPTRTGTTIEIYGLDELAGATHRASRHGRAAQRRQCAGGRRGGDRRSGSQPARIAAGLAGVRAASGGASSARARPAASWSTTTTATTRRPSARRWRPFASESPAGASGPSTSR